MSKNLKNERANNVLRIPDVINTERRAQGKTLTFYLAGPELASFSELQQHLRSAGQTNAVRAALKIAHLIVSKMEEGYEVHLEKPGAEKLTLTL